MLLETWLLLDYIYMHSDYSLLLPSSLSLSPPFHLYQSSLNPYLFLSQFQDFGDSLSLPKAICVTTEL